ncbi:MAG: hypothetical protein RLZZ480_388 [Candidatus Parcubacteria bacterium]|jgi:hypothetical protein
MFILNRRDSVYVKVAKELTATYASKLNLEQNHIELWFDRVELSLSLLLSNTFGKQSVTDYVHARAYQEVVRDILTHKDRDKILSKGQLLILERGLSHIIADVNKKLDESISPADIALFCEIAEGGRELFGSRNIDPRHFADNDVYELAQKIRGNYAAYEDTLRGLQLPDV